MPTTRRASSLPPSTTDRPHRERWRGACSFPSLLVAQPEGHSEDHAQQHEGEAEAGDVLLQRRELEPRPGQALLVDLQQLLGEGIAERRGLAIGEQEHDLDRFQLGPLGGIGQQLDGRRALGQVALAHPRRQDEHRRGAVLLAHPALGRLAVDLVHVEVFLEHLEQRVGHRALILVHHREEDALAALARLRLGDDEDDDDRNDQQETAADRSRTIRRRSLRVMRRSFTGRRPLPRRPSCCRTCAACGRARSPPTTW